ncbi:MAG: hypothetical protein JWL58_5295 [Streptosporangiaceae bacterium]|jgi:hypothetical protein|nr:hypothetical protein [Streptosporangiaceae bacterium]
MTAASKARALTRWGAVSLMAAAVLTATGGGFAQSYAGLYHWALEHGLHGWKAESFPLLVDLFIIVGELGLFLLALDAFVLHRRQLMSWLDFCLPLFIALAGWTASLIFNVGHVVQREFSYQATAAVPPIVSMLGLFVLLRTLHRYVATQAADQAAADAESETDVAEQRAIAPVTLQHITVMPLRLVGQPQPAAAQPRPLTAAEQEPTPSGVTMTAGHSPVASTISWPANGKHAAAERLQSATARGGVNGHASGGDSTSLWPDDPEPEPRPQPNPETMRQIIMKTLGRHNGDVTATCDDLAAEGYAIDEAEVRKARENHWFPYAVFRLLSKHHGDRDAVGRELTERGVQYDGRTLDDLVHSWRPPAT